MHEANSTTFEVDGLRFEIGRLGAAEGNWILGRMLNGMRDSALDAMAKQERLGIKPEPEGPAPTEEEIAEAEKNKPTPEQMAINAVRFLITNLSFEDIAKVHQLCLAVCSYVDPNRGHDLPVPVMLRSGLFAQPEFEHNIPVVMGLVAQTLIFNLTPFFVGGGLAKIMRPAATSQSPSPR